MDLIIPGTGPDQLITIDFSTARPSDHLRRLMEAESGIPDVGRWLRGLELGGKSDYLENKILDHNFGDGAFTSPTAWLALCTVVPEDSKTGSTITEAGYTGYARLKIEASAMSAASGGSKTTSEALTFAACTASSSTIIGWATCDASTVGNMLYWGSATSTVISTTQTPPTIASGGLTATED